MAKPKPVVERVIVEGTPAVTEAPSQYDSDTSLKTAILVAIGVVVFVAVLGVVLAPEKAAEIIGFCTLIAVTLLGAFQQARTAATAERAAVKVEEVKQALEVKATDTDEKLEEIKRVGDNNHILLNSGHGALLKLHADTARALATLTKSKSDITAAELAENELAQHEIKQGRVDAKDARDAKDKDRSEKAKRE